MDQISNVVLKPLRESIYIKPLCVEYVENGQTKTTTCSRVHDSVGILIYNTTRKVLVFVKQFRPAVYVAGLNVGDSSEVDVNSQSAEIGMTVEMCAGVVDKDLPLIDIAREEVLEETGYLVPNSKLEEVNTIQLHGSKMTTFYCEVTDDMKTESGGGVDDEMIDVIEMSVDEVRNYVLQDDILSPPSLLFCVYWFLYHKA